MYVKLYFLEKIRNILKTNLMSADFFPSILHINNTSTKEYNFISSTKKKEKKKKKDSIFHISPRNYFYFSNIFIISRRNYALKSQWIQFQRHVTKNILQNSSIENFAEYKEKKVKEFSTIKKNVL